MRAMRAAPIRDTNCGESFVAPSRRKPSTTTGLRVMLSFHTSADADA